MAQQHAQFLMGNVLHHLLLHQVVGQFGQAPGGERQVVVPGAVQGDPFDLFALGVGELRRASSGVVGMQGIEAVVVEMVQDVADRRRGW
ncbi:hypothetical protein E9229_003719 [Paeniglutamicibacter cryotolerans]|uniref:Uncharacterized protein n=1 Tax=Paeniglutamicibacter cryotolerans TaxID=670079 RepID=A0A839QVY9_9MICC|nr:hypothetical protein [Paeniglutamicibacter cryotolerans]MBB2997472.1 hypothetical protein [Paeniglutamicibacter cryotolerans]